MVTDHLGLVATGSTTFDAPYHVARRFASLDHLSGGRAGWNIVTTSNPDAALNFGMTDHMEHGERYRRAREFYDVVTGLWDSWADDAFIRDVEHGLFFDPDKLHVLNHKGKYLSVRGPLNIARPIQGWPVIVQAGASDSGRQLAAETAEAVFTPPSTIAAGREFYADVKGRMEKAGRARDHMKIMPACFVVVGDTVEAGAGQSAPSSTASSITTAPSPRCRLRSATTPRASIRTSRCRKSRRATPARAPATASSRWRRGKISPCASWRSGSAAIPASPWSARPKTIADEMEEWLVTEASDGFTIMFPYLPGGLDDFVEQVVPELQRRGMFRREYEGKTLARKSRPAAAGEPILRNPQGGGVTARGRRKIKRREAPSREARPRCPSRPSAADIWD